MSANATKDPHRQTFCTPFGAFTLKMWKKPSQIPIPGPNGPALRFVAAALIVRGGEVLIGQRRPDQPMARCGSFPAARSRPARARSRRWPAKLDEELGIQATIGPRVTRIRHNYRHGGAVDLQFFAVHEFSGESRTASISRCAGCGWKTLPATSFPGRRPGLIRGSGGGEAAVTGTSLTDFAHWFPICQFAPMEGNYLQSHLLRRRPFDKFRAGSETPGSQHKPRGITMALTSGDSFDTIASWCK
jgi:8-oxo-dGTP diphosphatase